MNQSGENHCQVKPISMSRCFFLDLLYQPSSREILSRELKESKGAVTNQENKKKP